MLASARCLTFIKGYEKCRLKAFKPTPEDVWTIGWGRTAGVYAGMVCTQAQADAWAIADMVSRAKSVSAAIGTAKTTQAQFDAMTSLVYNIGIGTVELDNGFITSTVLRDHKAGLYPAAADAFLLWDKQKGKVLAGLVARRNAERLMYLGG